MYKTEWCRTDPEKSKNVLGKEEKVKKDNKRFVINLFNDYAKIISEVNFKATKGTSLKILTTKQIFQRLK